MRTTRTEITCDYCEKQVEGFVCVDGPPEHYCAIRLPARVVFQVNGTSLDVCNDCTIKLISPLVRRQE